MSRGLPLLLAASLVGGCSPVVIDDLPTRSPGVVTPPPSPPVDPTPTQLGATSSLTNPSPTPTDAGNTQGPTATLLTPTPGAPTTPTDPTSTASPTPGGPTATSTPDATPSQSTAAPTSPTDSPTHGITPTGPATPWPDRDGDGSLANADCDDTNPQAYPDAPELCDEVDNDCDSKIDEGQTEAFFADLDGDGYGDPDKPVEACGPGESLSSNGGDCNDGDDKISPDGNEVCDGADQDCDGDIDEGRLIAFFPDNDSDGYGSDDGNDAVLACEPPGGYGLGSDDCDDGDRQVSPGIRYEYADDKDNDCDEAVDEISDPNDANLVIPGRSNVSLFGGRIVSLGDFDVDGHPDFAVSATTAVGGRGTVTLYYGDDQRITGDSQPQAVVLQGDGLVPGTGTALAGTAIASGGDIDGDGVPELVIGQPGLYGSGRVSVIKGRTAQRLTTETELEDISLSLFSFTGGGLGTSATLADVDGDGHKDLFFGAPFAGDHGLAYWIPSYAVPVSIEPDDRDISTLAQTITADLFSGRFGQAMETVGDIDGDSFEDVVIGAPSADVPEDDGDFCDECGGIAIIYGTDSGNLLDPARMSIISGRRRGDLFGQTIGRAGDLNNDGYDDFLVGAPHFDVNDGDDDEYSNGGAVYVILGGSQRIPSGFNIHQIPSENRGPRIVCNQDDCDTGNLFTAYGLGDVDGDLRDDFAVGAQYYRTGEQRRGTIGLFLSDNFNFNARELSITSADARFVGAREDDSLSSMGPAGDLDGDGYDDFVLGAYLANVDNTTPGSAYLFYGY